MELADYDLKGIEEWASLVLVRVWTALEKRPTAKAIDDQNCEAFVFVVDPKFGPEAKVKLAAGHRNKLLDPTPLETAKRELAGETGLQPLSSAFTYVGKWLGWRKDHWKCLFVADIDRRELEWMNDSHSENEGEGPKRLTPGQFHALAQRGGVLEEHRRKLQEFGLIAVQSQPA